MLRNPCPVICSFVYPSRRSAMFTVLRIGIAPRAALMNVAAADRRDAMGMSRVQVLDLRERERVIAASASAEPDTPSAQAGSDARAAAA